MKPDTTPLRKWAMKHLVKTDRIVRVTHGSAGYYSYEDMGEIIRCIDCAHAVDNGAGEAGYCGRPDGDGGYLLFAVEPDGFCAWAGRK